jgi:hypothetical protein
VERPEAVVHGEALPKEDGTPLAIDVRQTQVWLVAHEHNSVPLRISS